MCIGYKVFKGLRKSINHLVYDDEVHSKIQSEVQCYKKVEGSLLKSFSALKQKSIMLPRKFF